MSAPGAVASVRRLGQPAVLKVIAWTALTGCALPTGFEVLHPRTRLALMVIGMACLVLAERRDGQDGGGVT